MSAGAGPASRALSRGVWVAPGGGGKLVLLQLFKRARESRVLAFELKFERVIEVTVAQ